MRQMRYFVSYLRRQMPESQRQRERDRERERERERESVCVCVCVRVLLTVQEVGRQGPNH